MYGLKEFGYIVCFFPRYGGKSLNWTFGQESDMTTFYILPFTRITESLLNKD